MGGGTRITGLVKCVGKRKLPAETDSPGAKQRRLSSSNKPVLYFFVDYIVEIFLYFVQTTNNLLLIKVYLHI